MEEKTNQTQSAVFNYTAPRAVRMGDVFYRVESGESVYFREPCKVCDGTGQLTVKGVTFKCPCCDAQKEVISVNKYIVRRYRVFKIEKEAGTSEWKPCDYKDIKFSLYRKVGHGYCPYSGGGNMVFTDREFAKNYNRPFDENAGRGAYGIYDDYNLAVRVAEQMTARELKRLAEYNKEYGTAHEAVFKAKKRPEIKLTEAADMANIERHKQLCAQLTDTYQKKNADYGNSFGDTFADLGIISAITRIADKFNRVKNLAKLPPDRQRVKSESITDTLLDMANYCIMTVIEIENQNKQGGANNE